MLNDTKNDLDIIEEKIQKCLEEMEIVSSLIVKTNVDILKIENELQLSELDIRLNTDFKAVGCKNKEERELYIMNVPEYREKYLVKRDLEIDLSEYRHRYGVNERQLKLYNRIYDRLKTLESYELEKDLNKNE